MSVKSQEAKKQLENEYCQTQPGNGAKTCDYYKIEDVPDRFNNPEAAHNLGNPVFSCPANVSSPVQDRFKGYDKKMTHPMYMTSAMDYGSRKPTVHVMPQQFHAKSQKFTSHLGQCGMYRNNSLNTAVDKSPVSSNLDGVFH